MPVPALTLKAYEMTRVDRAIMNFAEIDNPSVGDILARQMCGASRRRH